MSLSQQNNESKFDLFELFFSLTDKRGIIESFNKVFVRVSEFSPEELYKKPHNIIRHPDTPRAVFKLLWDVISDQRPLCAYVKNKTKKGKHYWVFAMAFPVHSGYVSIRIKPSSIYFEKIENLYKQMLSVEKSKTDRNEGISLSTALLENTIKTLGFDNYEDLMKVFLVEELQQRRRLLSSEAQGLSQETIPKISQTTKSSIAQLYNISQSCFKNSSALFQSVLGFEKSIDYFDEVAKEIKMTGHEVNLFTTNLVISADQLGQKGAVLSVVSEGFGKMAAEIKEEIEKLSASIALVRKDHSDMKFYAAVSQLQIEMLYFFIKEILIQGWSEDPIISENEKSDFKKKSDLLKILVSENINKIESQLTQFRNTFSQVSKSIQDLTSIITGMDVIKISGKIEISRISDATQSLSNHVDTMAHLNLVFKSSISKIFDESRSALFQFEKVGAEAGNINKELLKLNSTEL
ncbi:MAG TPA: PAS domain-containing protein [Pseudobdellovibrionaceae bacterium]|nr:PAS domain-containing protein [Pseudobdellovibrionaceae bacterium]